MREGTVVVVTANLDERVRAAISEPIGTVVKGGDEVWVLFHNGDLWIGPAKQVFEHKEKKDELLPSEGQVPRPDADGDDRGPS